MPASSATATRRSTTAPWSSSSASRARRPTPWCASARPSGAGTRPWRSSTPWAARSPARPTAASTSTPAPRSASPAPRRSRRRSPCSPCWPSTWAGCATSRSPTAWPSSTRSSRSPTLIGEALKTEPAVEEAAARIAGARNALYLGRDLHFPVALEGALKLKEISYIHAEGYPTAEMKHGPIALVDRRDPLRLRRAPRFAPRQDAQQHRGGPGPRRLHRRRRHRGRRLGRRALGHLPADPRRPRDHPAAAGRRPVTAPGLPRRPPSGLRHRQAPQPRQERHRRMIRRCRPRAAPRETRPPNPDGIGGLARGRTRGRTDHVRPAR